jgi:carbonic anhydrase/acetyltransferase-like protein (isoleucine patch superfamily)
MAIYALGDIEPSIDPSAYVHPDAVVIGDVVIGAEASVWPCAVLRGDDGRIEVGARTSIQDGTVVHTTPEQPTVVGADCVVGHLVHLEGCTIEDGALVGNGSIVLHRAVVRTGAVVGSGAVVPADLDVPAGALALGIPARIKEGAADPAMITHARDSYLRRTSRYQAELRRLDSP